MLKEVETPKKKWGKWIALAILGLLVLYVVGDGYLFNKIEPQTVVAVYEPGGIRALINKTDTPKRMWKWPRILGTSIGVTEEPIKIEPKTTSLKFAMYTLDKATGNPEDKDYVQAYVVDVKLEVKDWQNFFRKIDLDKINEQRRAMGPFVNLVKDRFEVVADPVLSIIRTGDMTDRFGKPLKTEEGYQAMNLSSRMAYGESRLLSDRNIIFCLIDAFGFENAQEIKEYLKEKEPWMFFAGVSTFEQLAEQHKELQEYTMSELVKGLTPEGGQKRFVFGTDRLKLFFQAYRAWQYQDFLMEAKAKLEDIALQRKDLQGKVDKALYSQSEVVVKSFKDWLSLNGGDIKFIQNLEQLSQNYQMFGGQIEFNITFAFRRDEVDTINKNITEAEKRFLEISEEDKLEAKKFVQGLLKSLKEEINREIWQVSAQDLNQVFEYYLAKYLAKNELKNLSEGTKRYFGLQVTKAYVEALSNKVKEAEKFLNEVQIAQGFYLDIRAKLQGQKVDMSQLMESYFQEKQELFQTAAYLINLSWQEATLNWQKVQWEGMVEEELIPFFKYYSCSNEELPMMVRRVTAEENEALWDAAIEEVLAGEDISKYGSHWIHHVKEGETLAQIVKKYNVGWQSLFGPTPRSTIIPMVFRSLEKEEKMVEFNQLVTKAMETGDYTAVYEFAKDVSLKPVPTRSGDIILINKVEKEYSEKWFELDKANREQREKIIKRYLYKWLEKFAPKVIEEYIPVSPWIDYIERLYGVEIIDVKLRIEKDKMFNKAGQVKDEYYELWVSEHGNAKLEEEEK